MLLSVSFIMMLNDIVLMHIGVNDKIIVLLSKETNELAAPKSTQTLTVSFSLSAMVGSGYTENCEHCKVCTVGLLTK